MRAGYTLNMVEISNLKIVQEAVMEAIWCQRKIVSNSDTTGVREHGYL